ncbi:hypothetical protein HYPSUDRAFT_39795 [Hypholoma sublateritium FD-334 SS-4]|uniref:Uncharacterized protein n=1 Tax=Hypholoma sublateritium (strain FD-334 SS-4) TaxID=945553 RepID=A0A0D2PVQ6_HYPSF|nr:hypothetical protein HYPSUDRAFT_39795 [Hypholoma sublateritium FD-334 SS-4]
MVRLSATCIGLLSAAASAHALTLNVTSLLPEDSIVQNTTAALAPWKEVCQALSADPSNPLCQTFASIAENSLKDTENPCARQDAADALIFASNFGNATLITLAQIFVQQPANSVRGFANPFCQRAPLSSQLIGLYPCQFASSVDQTDGDPGALPLGVTDPVSPPGSCLVHPAGPIEDGTQLVDVIDLSEIPGTVSQSSPVSESPAPTSSVSVPPSTASDAPSSNEGAVIIADTTMQPRAPSSTSDTGESSVLALMSADIVALNKLLTPSATAASPRMVKKRRAL